MKTITAVSGSFDDIRSIDLKFLAAAAGTGDVNLYLWSDAMHEKIHGGPPKFSFAERLYFTEALIYVDKVIPVGGFFNPDSLPGKAETWFIRPEEVCRNKKTFCDSSGVKLQIFDPSGASPEAPAAGLRQKADSAEKRIIVTGCYDHFHTGHIRFFEEASEYGRLTVVIGSDRNVELLKGPSHPHYREDERLFMVQSIKYVDSAFISTGSGWMDAQPEIERLRPDIYIVNQDGDKPEKREFCAQHNLQYLILNRVPKEGLPPRTSTDLRGF